MLSEVWIALCLMQFTHFSRKIQTDGKNHDDVFSGNLIAGGIACGNKPYSDEPLPVMETYAAPC